MGNMVIYKCETVCELACRTVLSLVLAKNPGIA